MTNSSYNYSRAHDFNEETLHLRIPALVFLSITLFVGVFGNATVMYIYGFRMKRTNVFFFANLLSLSDFTCCLIVIPLEMFRIRQFYAYHADCLCRLESYFLFCCYINSTFLLLIISIERYIKVCRITTGQMKLSLARKLGIVSGLISTLLAIPALIWTVPKNYLVDGHILSYRCSPYLDLRLFRYAIIVFGSSFIVWVIMLVLYFLVLRTIKRQETWNLAARTVPSMETESSMREKSAKKLNQTNRIVLCVSLVFVCTCSLYFSFVLVNMMSVGKKSTDHMHYFLFLLNESWVVNIVFNPIVYGFMNTQLRKEIYKLLGLSYKVTLPETESPAGNSNSSNSNTT